MGNLHGDSRCLHSRAEAGDQAPNNQMRHGKSRRLKSGADDDEAHSGPNGLAAAQLLAEDEVD